MSRTPVRLLAIIYIPAFVVLTAVAFSAFALRMPVGLLTGDLAGLVHVSPLLGVLNSLGVLLWCSTAAICLFAAAIIRGRVENIHVLFLVGFAFLTLILMFDDLFMFHEYLSSEYLGLRQRYVILTYMGLTAGLLVSFRKVILASDYPLLVVALACFAFSVGIEKAVYYNKDSWLYLAEDGSKFLGLAGWAGYFVRYAYLQVAAAWACADERVPDSQAAEQDCRHTQGRMSGLEEPSFSIRNETISPKEASQS